MTPAKLVDLLVYHPPRLLSGRVWVNEAQCETNDAS